MHMKDNTIKISGKEKITTIRLKEKTKKMLEALGQGKETHEEILLRLIKLTNQLNSQTGTEIVQRGRVTGTKYDRSNRIFIIEHRHHTYSVVCTYNDLTIMNMLRQSGRIRKYIAHDREPSQWEVDLEIVNIKKNKGGWQSPKSFEHQHPREFMIFYLACLKQVLEESFDITLYEIDTEEDLFNLSKWDKAYGRTNLSRESFYTDVQEKLKGIK